MPSKARYVGSRGSPSEAAFLPQSFPGLPFAGEAGGHREGLWGWSGPPAQALHPGTDAGRGCSSQFSPLELCKCSRRPPPVLLYSGPGP